MTQLSCLKANKISFSWWVCSRAACTFYIFAWIASLGNNLHLQEVFLFLLARMYLLASQRHLYKEPVNFSFGGFWRGLICSLYNFVYAFLCLLQEKITSRNIFSICVISLHGHNSSIKKCISLWCFRALLPVSFMFYISFGSIYTLCLYIWAFFSIVHLCLARSFAHFSCYIVLLLPLPVIFL